MVLYVFRKGRRITMTPAQKRLRERQSRERGRMAELALVDEMSDEHRSELDTIERGTPDLERQIRVAMVAAETEERIMPYSCGARRVRGRTVSWAVRRIGRGVRIGWRPSGAINRANEAFAVVEGGVRGPNAAPVANANKDANPYGFPHGRCVGSASLGFLPALASVMISAARRRALDAETALSGAMVILMMRPW